MFDTRPQRPTLHPGPHGLPRDHVAEIQRGRIIAAAIEAVAEIGYARMTVAQVIARARVSRKTFYDIFDDREDCFLAVFEATAERARAEVLVACEGIVGWRERIRTALARLLSLMDAEPALARLCVVDALAAGDRVLVARRRILAELAAAVDRGREGVATATQPPPLAGEAVVGAVFSVVHSRLLTGDSDPLEALLGSLMSTVVLPYLGPRAASRELDAPPPGAWHAPASSDRAEDADPLAGLDMRLTYRTLRVLSVIGEHAGASNREIAERSGISDQGQISKLLGRLGRLELVCNTGEGPERGAANSWHLTARGRRLEQATRRP